jgi:ABC-type lipoprotein export system ATPase subunit
MASGGAILDLFGELNDAGVTLVVVTHDEEVAAQAGRIIEVRDGRVVADSGVSRRAEKMGA